MIDSYTIANQILAVYALFLTLFGTVGNILSMRICLHDHLRKIPTFAFLFLLLISDTLALYSWNLDHFIQTFWGFMLDDLNIHWCRWTTFLQCFSFQSSAWLLVFYIYFVYFKISLSEKIKNGFTKF